MPISSTITLQQVVAADSIPSNTGRIRTPNIQIPANLGNLGVKLRQQTTASDVSKGIRDGHAQKENSHKIKGNNCNYFNEALHENYEGNKKPENIVTPSFPWKATSKSTFVFEKKTIRANKTTCDILKNGHKLPFFNTPSNAEFKNNSSALKTQNL